MLCEETRVMHSPCDVSVHSLCNVTVSRILSHFIALSSIASWDHPNIVASQRARARECTSVCMHEVLLATRRKRVAVLLSSDAVFLSCRIHVKLSAVIVEPGGSATLRDRTTLDLEVSQRMQSLDQ